MGFNSGFKGLNYPVDLACRPLIPKIKRNPFSNFGDKIRERTNSNTFSVCIFYRKQLQHKYKFWSLLFIQLIHNQIALKFLKFTSKFTWEMLLHVSVFHNHHQGANIRAPWWWLWKTETCRIISHVNFDVNFKNFKTIWLCISWINKRLYNINMHGTTVKKKIWSLHIKSTLWKFIPHITLYICTVGVYTKTVVGELQSDLQVW